MISVINNDYQWLDRIWSVSLPLTTPSYVICDSGEGLALSEFCFFFCLIWKIELEVFNIYSA